MKKLFCVLFHVFLLVSLSACGEAPNSLQMDIYKGTAQELKLLHVNASSAEKRQQIEGITKAIMDAEPIEKGLDLFAFYPDYTIVVDAPKEPGKRITVILDINYDRLEFYYTGPYPEKSETLYRSQMTAAEFKTYVNLE